MSFNPMTSSFGPLIADYARGAVTSSPTYRYVYADCLGYAGYVDEPILRHTGTTTTLPTTGDNALYYHRNQQYSIVGLTNAAGTLVERYTYSAYGTLGIYAANGTVRTSSTYANRYTYTGREWDAELRLYHFRARWYDPATGGFVTRDPLGYVDGMSLYRGYFAQPGTDPSGLLSIREIGIIGIAVAIQSLVCKRLEDDAIANHRARTPTIQESKCFNDAFKTMPRTYCQLSDLSSFNRGSFRWLVSHGNNPSPPVTHCAPMCFLEQHGSALVFLGPSQLKCDSCEGFLNLMMTLLHECVHIKQKCPFEFMGEIHGGLNCNEFWAYSSSMLAMYNSHQQICRDARALGYCGDNCERILFGLIKNDFIEYQYYQTECWKDHARRHAESSKICHHNRCFVAGTLVQCNDSLKRVEDIVVGDFVSSYSIENEVWESRNVVGVHRSVFEGTLVKLDLGDELGEIICTEFHPFWVTNSKENSLAVPDNPEAAEENVNLNAQWVQAAAMRPGDRLLTRSGREIVVQNVYFAVDCVTVYNLSVDRNRNYAIGTNGILVHNK